MASKLQRLWKFLERHAGAVFCAVLVLESLILLVLCRKGQVADALDQFLLGIGQLQQGGRITSTFLPIGYAAPVGWAERMLGLIGIRPVYGLMLVGAATMLALVALARQYLRHQGCPATLASAGALLLGCNPRLLFRVTCVEDTNLTALLLIAILLTAVMLRRKPGMRWAVLGGVAYGAAVLVRPNLIVMLLPFLLALWKRPLRAQAVCLVQLLAIAAIVYTTVTSMAHGRPFFPRNGPYNVFAGNNEFTAKALHDLSNGESSLLPAMRTRGYPVVVHWKKQSDQPGIDDARDLRYAPVYVRETIVFARQHPAEIVRLAGLKLYAFFYETTADVFEWHGVLIVAAIVVKMLAILTIPAWFLLWFIVIAKRMPHDTGTDWIVLSMTLLFVLPFVVTNSAARFRPPLEALLFVDSFRLLYILITNGNGAPVRVRHSENSLL